MAYRLMRAFGDPRDIDDGLISSNTFQLKRTRKSGKKLGPNLVTLTRRAQHQEVGSSHCFIHYLFALQYVTEKNVDSTRSARGRGNRRRVLDACKVLLQNLKRKNKRKGALSDLSRNSFRIMT